MSASLLPPRLLFGGAHPSRDRLRGTAHHLSTLNGSQESEKQNLPSSLAALLLSTIVRLPLNLCPINPALVLLARHLKLLFLGRSRRCPSRRPGCHLTLGVQPSLVSVHRPDLIWTQPSIPFSHHHHLCCVVSPLRPPRWLSVIWWRLPHQKIHSRSAPAATVIVLLSRMPPPPLCRPSDAPRACIVSALSQQLPHGSPCVVCIPLITALPS